MNILYRFLAEAISILHFGVVLLGFLIGIFWERMFMLYSLIFLFGAPSWFFLGKCFLTDIENNLRLKSGQDISSVKKSFTGYWGAKILGKHLPSDRAIFWIIIGFYIGIIPIWFYEIYIRYIV